MLSVISGIVAIFKAVPVFDAWFKALVKAYLEMKIAAHDKEFVDATRSLIADHDQRKLEEAVSGHESLPAQDQTDVHTRPGRS